MPIDRQQVIDETAYLIPEENIFDNDDMLQIADDVVNYQVTEDDDEYLPEAKCKFLLAIARLNGLSNPNVGNLRKDKQLDSELEWQEYLDIWSSFEKSLEYACPLFGYTGLTSKRVSKQKIDGVFRDKFVVNPCV